MSEEWNRSGAEREVRRFAGIQVARLMTGVVLLILMPVAIAIGIVVFAAIGIVAFGPWMMLGAPDLGPFSPALGLGWFIGSLIVLFLVLRRGHRWITRVLDLASIPVLLVDPDLEAELTEGHAPGGEDEPPDPVRLEDRVAAADSRLVPTSTPTHEPSRPAAPGPRRPPP